MRQGDGADVLDANDARTSDIGIIYVAPNDDRQSVLAAILTQDKLGRKQIAVVLPEENKAFQNSVDFDGLKNMRRGLKAQIVIVSPGGRGPAEYARQRRFPVYSSMENFSKSLQEEEPLPEAAKKGWLFGRKQRPINAPPPVSTGRRERTQPLTPEQMGQQTAPEQQEAADYLEQEPAQPRRRGMGGPLAAGAAGAGLGLAAGLAGRRQPPPPEDYATNETVSSNFEDDSEDWNTFGPPSDTDSEDFLTPPLQHADEVPEEEEEQRGGGVGLAGAAAAGAAGGLVAEEAGPEIIKMRSGRQPRGIDTVELADKKPKAQPPFDPDAVKATPILPSEDERPSRRRGGRGMLGAGLLGAGAGLAAGEAARAQAQTPSTARNARAGGAGLAAGGVANAQTPPQPRNQNAQTPSQPRNSNAVAAGALLGSGAAGGTPPPRRPPQGQGRSRRGGPTLLLVAALVIFFLLLGFVALAYASPSTLGPLARVVPGVTSGAKITITPASQHLVRNYVLTAVSNPDSNPNDRQVRSRILTVSTPAQSKTVPATMHKVQAAQPATGKITFYNINSTDVVVNGGTDFIVGRIHVITDGPVDVPPGNLPTAGSASVSAHSSVPGTIGNIAAGVINRSCCGAGVAAKNNADFTGGQDPQNFIAVAQSDINNAANPLKTSQLASAQRGLQSQLKPNESVIGSATCNPKIGSNHQAGDKASNVTVTVSVDCRAIVYDHTAAQTLATSLLKQDATTSPGAGYALVGDILTTVTPGQISDPTTGKVSLLVKTEGIWVYQISDAQKGNLLRNLGGKSKKDAQTYLTHQPGIAAADIQYNGDPLPTDLSQISLEIAAVNGLKATPTPGAGTPTIPISGSPTSTTSQGNG